MRRMAELNAILKIINAFYSKFILRDFFGKIISGSLFLIMVSFAIIRIEHAVIFYDYLKNFWIWVIFIGISWLIGFAIQGIGTKEIKTNNGERKNYQLIRVFPKEYTNKEGEDLYNKFKEKCKDYDKKEQHERYVVVKEACGNGGASLLFSSIFLLLNIIILLDNSIKYESFLSY